MDDRKIKARKPEDMTTDDLQIMQNILGWSHEYETLGLKLGGLLAFYHLANDAGYVSWVEWYGEKPVAAERARARLAARESMRKS